MPQNTMDTLTYPNNNFSQSLPVNGAQGKKHLTNTVKNVIGIESVWTIETILINYIDMQPKKTLPMLQYNY